MITQNNPPGGHLQNTEVIFGLSRSLANVMNHSCVFKQKLAKELIFQLPNALGTREAKHLPTF